MAVDLVVNGFNSDVICMYTCYGLIYKLDMRINTTYIIIELINKYILLV